MPTMQGQRTLTAGETVANLLRDALFEQMPYNGMVQFGLVQSVTGTKLDVFSGADMLAEDFEPQISASLPKFPDDFTLTDVAAAGEKLKIKANNPTAGSIIVRWAVKIDPI